MQNVFIFHGTAGYPEENWFPWLKQELEQKGCDVIIPQFPTPEGQSFDAWLRVLVEYEKHINEDTIFIGHSLGGLFLLRLLERSDKQFKAAMFIGTPIGVKPLSNYERDSDFSGGFNFNWSAIKTKANHFAVYHSDNDPYVSLGNGEKLSEMLETGLSFVPGAGHFNTKAGYTTFPELLVKLDTYLDL